MFCFCTTYLCGTDQKWTLLNSLNKTKELWSESDIWWNKYGHSLHNQDQNYSIWEPSYSMFKQQPYVNWVSKSQHHCHGNWRGSSQCSTEMSANGANRLRWSVVTSIWKFKYLTAQISGHLKDNFLCTEILFFLDSRKTAHLKTHFEQSLLISGF